MIRAREYAGTYPNFGGYDTTRYNYDALGNLIDVWDAANNNTHITYDALGRKTGMSDPDMGYWQYLYDANGNLEWQQDPNLRAAGNRWLKFSYDALNRLTHKQLAENSGAVVSTLAQHYYDALWDGSVQPYGKGRRVASWAPGVNEAQWVYDPRGRVSAHSSLIYGVGSFLMSYYFDSADRPNGMYYPNAEWVQATYNPAGQPDSLLWWTAQHGTNAYVNTTTYNVLGQPLVQAYANGTSRTNAYHPANYRLTAMWVTTSSGTDTWPLWKQFGYDAVGNIATTSGIG